MVHWWWVLRVRCVLFNVKTVLQIELCFYICGLACYDKPLKNARKLTSFTCRTKMVKAAARWYNLRYDFFNDALIWLDEATKSSMNVSVLCAFDHTKLEFQIFIVSSVVHDLIQNSHWRSVHKQLWMNINDKLRLPSNISNFLVKLKRFCSYGLGVQSTCEMIQRSLQFSTAATIRTT